MFKSPIQLYSPAEIETVLSQRVRALRLVAGWKQATLAKRSGVTLGSLKRFEHTGKISLENLLKLAYALGRIDEFSKLFERPRAFTLDDLEKLEKPLPKRGRK